MVGIRLTMNKPDCVGISLIASTFKCTNQLVIGGIRAKGLFPLLQHCSPGRTESRDDQYFKLLKYVLNLLQNAVLYVL